MLKHKSQISAELPEYLHSTNELTKPATTTHMAARGRKSLLNAVSYDAPESFLLKHIQPLTPEVRRNVLVLSSPKTKPGEVRLMHELRSARYQEFQKFTYVDFDRRQKLTVDYNSLPFGVGTDLVKDKNAGARTKLPFYKAYAKATANGQFRMRQGMFSHKANQSVIGRAGGEKLRSLRSVSSPANHTRGRQIEPLSGLPKETHTPKPISLDMSLCVYSSTGTGSFKTKAMRSLFNSPKKKSWKTRTKSLAIEGDGSQDIDSFDLKRKTDPVFKPVTKATLGLII